MTGRWIFTKKVIKTNSKEQWCFKCSRCNREIGTDYNDNMTEFLMKNYPYCHCGAQMVLTKEEEKSFKDYIRTTSSLNPVDKHPATKQVKIKPKESVKPKESIKSTKEEQYIVRCNNCGHTIFLRSRSYYDSKVHDKCPNCFCKMYLTTYEDDDYNDNTDSNIFDTVNSGCLYVTIFFVVIFLILIFNIFTKNPGMIFVIILVIGILSSFN